jgi:hypothetical protein
MKDMLACSVSLGLFFFRICLQNTSHCLKEAAQDVFPWEATGEEIKQVQVERCHTACKSLSVLTSLFSLILRFEVQVFTKPYKQIKKKCNAIEAHWRKPLQLAVSPSQLFQVGMEIIKKLVWVPAVATLFTTGN